MNDHNNISPLDQISGWAWKRVAWHAISTCLLIITFFLLVDLLRIVVQMPVYGVNLFEPRQLIPAPTELPRSLPSSSDRWEQMLTDPATPILTRTVEISITSSTAVFTTSLVVSDTNPLVAEAAQGSIFSDVPLFTRLAFGDIRIRDESLVDSAYPVILEIDPQNSTAAIRVIIEKSFENPPYLEITPEKFLQGVAPRFERVSVHISGLSFLYISPNPYSASKDRVVFQGHSPDRMERIFLSTSFRDDSSNTITYISRQNIVDRLGDLLDDHPLGTWLYGILEVLPLILFVVLFVQIKDLYGQQAQYVRCLLQATCALLVLHLVYSFSAGSANWLPSDNLLKHISTVLGEFLNLWLGYHMRLTLGNGVFFTSFVTLGIILPQGMGAWFPPEQETGGTPGHSHLSLVLRILWGASFLAFALGWLLVGVYAIPAVTEYTYSRELLPVPAWVFWMPAFSILIALVYIVLGALYRKIALQRAPSGLVLLSVYLLVEIEALISLLSRTFDWRADSFSWFMLTGLLGTALALALVRVATRMNFRAGCRKKLSKVARRWGIVLLFLLVFPLYKLYRPDGSLAHSASMMNLAIYLDNFVPLVWLMGVVWLLYYGGRQSSQLSAPIRLAAILVISSVLFSPTSQWLYIPVRFLVGWLLLNSSIRLSGYWDKPKPVEAWDKPQSLYEMALSNRPVWLEKIATIRAADSALRDYRKELVGQLTKGELTTSQFGHLYQARQSELDTYQRETRVQSYLLKDVALVFGPYPTAWQNAWHGAKFGLLLGLPWIVLFLKDFLGASVYPPYHPLLNYAQTILIVTLRWVLVGFALGYFYPYLRGKNGLQKGFGLFLVVVLPSLPLAAIYNENAADWQALLLWALEMFTHCMLLGLIAFDYWTLRQEKRDWQALFDVHGFTYLGVSVSTILAAIATAIVTLLTTQTTSLISASLKFLLPQMPVDLP